MRSIKFFTSLLFGLIYLHLLVIWQSPSLEVLLGGGLSLILCIAVMTLDWRIMASINIPAIITATSLSSQEWVYSAYFLSIGMFVLFSITLLILFYDKILNNKIKVFFIITPTVVGALAVFNGFENIFMS